MMDVRDENEFRVRPVTRYNLTHYESNGRAAGVRSLGEFDSIDAAEEVGVALHATRPGSTFVTLHAREPKYAEPMVGEYVVVAVHTYTVENTVYFASSLQQAKECQAMAQIKHGTEFRIYSR